MNKAKSKRQY